MISGQTSQPSGLVFKIQKYSIHDGPGIRTTVFLKGCPLCCWWCHNPESISPEVETVAPGSGRAAGASAGGKERIGREMTVSQVVAEAEKDRLFYEESGGGVTLSGGEPLMQPDFVLGLARAFSGLDLHVTLDTSGHGNPHVLEELLGLADLVLYDLKLADPEAHQHYTGLGNELILDNLHRLDAARVPYRIRFPVIPGITETETALEQLASLLAELHRRPEIDLLPYHASAEAKYERLGRAYRLQGLEPPSPERMASIASLFRRYGLKAHIGGQS